MNQPTVDSPTQSSAAAATNTDRRRPGRRDYDNSALIDLLRSPSQPAPVRVEADSLTVSDADDDLASARGILVSLLIGGLIWAAIGTSFWLLLGG